MCDECMEKPCPIAEAAHSVLGSWARERKKQGVGMFDELPSQPEMDDAVDEPVTGLMSAACPCACHGREK